MSAKAARDPAADPEREQVQTRVGARPQVGRAGQAVRRTKVQLEDVGVPLEGLSGEPGQGLPRVLRRDRQGPGRDGERAHGRPRESDVNAALLHEY